MKINQPAAMRIARQCLAITSVLVVASVGNAEGNSESFIVFDDSECAGTAMDIVHSMAAAENYEGAKSVKRIGSSYCWALV